MLPFYDNKIIALELRHLGGTMKQVTRIMKKFGLRAIYPKKNFYKPSMMQKNTHI